ncbi:DUF5789 family protein [Salinibaculum rarum]|uniref:DUF5789 family protein n=1 Tax=Salinibaculum rarum TaxID=3058903 RepID=UPI00265FD8B9|nr:hypothetical protein [Salinibaculum sp. KK48]
MRLPETRDLFARKLEFPMSRDAVVETVGDEELDAPAGENETIGEVLGRSETDEFRSADDLYGTLMTFVGDAFIGRKYYDDRGGSSLAIDEEDEEVKL